MTIEEYEKKMRDYGMSEDDISFMLDVYERHLDEDSEDNDKTYRKFCCKAIADGLNPNDIRTSVEAFERLRLRHKEAI